MLRLLCEELYPKRREVPSLLAYAFFFMWVSTLRMMQAWYTRRFAWCKRDKQEENFVSAYDQYGARQTNELQLSWRKRYVFKEVALLI